MSSTPSISFLAVISFNVKVCYGVIDGPADKNNDRRPKPGWNTSRCLAAFDEELFLITFSIGADHDRDDTIDNAMRFEAFNRNSRTVTNGERYLPDPLPARWIFSHDRQDMLAIDKFA